MDVLNMIYDALIADDYIKEQATGRIKFYEYPATGEVTAPYIVIDPLSSPLPQEYGDDEPIADAYIYQIDVWTKNAQVKTDLAKRVAVVMRSIGFANYASGVDDYDGPTGIYRDARRYRSTIYNDNIN